jgi:glycosyltransferase involved in cell wall biosynthesis
MVQVVADGITLDGYGEGGGRARETGEAPVLGYFARMCPEKGLGVLVEAFIELRSRGTVSGLRLKIGGGCGPADQAYVEQMKKRLQREALGDAVSWHPNLERREKIAFLESLTVFSVPATYPEAFGMYVAEAMAAGVPVVQPRIASFPDFIRETGGGVVYDPAQPGALATALEDLLLHREDAVRLGEAGRRAVQDHYSAEQMARRFCAVLNAS